MNKMYTRKGGSIVNTTLFLVSSTLNRLNLKSIGKQLMVVALFLMCGLVQKVWGQSAKWNNTTTYTPSVCGSATATAPSFYGVTLGGTQATYGYSAYGWTTSTSINYGEYLQFTMTNTSASAITVTNVNLNTYYASGYVDMYWNIGYSVGTSAPAVSATTTAIGSNPAIDNATGAAGTSNNTTSISIPASSTIYIRIYGYNSDGTSSGYIGGVTSLSLSVASPTAPTGFAATAGNTQNVLTSTSTSTALLAWNTTNTFGTPVAGTVYSSGNTITGGGTVLYNAASGTNFYTQTGLTNGTPIYYSLWDVGASSCTYSTAVTANATPVYNLYWGGTATGTYPGSGYNVWTSGSIWGTSTASGATTTWPSSGNIPNANFNAATANNVTIPSSFTVVPLSVNINAPTSFNTGASTNGALSAPIVMGAYTLTAAPVTTTTLALSGNISGASGIINQNGAGTTTLSGTNSYGGGTTLTSGQLNVNTTSALGTGTLTISGAGTLDNTSGGNIAITNPMSIGSSFTYAGSANNLSQGTGAIAMTTSPTITVSGNTLALGGVISGSTYKITKAGSGALTLSATNTFTGGVTLNAGTLNINKGAALGTTTGTFTIAGGTIDNTFGSSVTTSNYPQAWNGDFTFTGSNALNLGTGAVALGATRQVTISANTLTVGGIISGSTYGITKLGSSGTLLLTNAANTYSGTTTITAGTVTLNPSSTTATFASQINMNGGTLSTSGITAATTFTNSSTLNLSASSIIALGTNTHSIKFAASNGIGWTGSTVLQITGWTGTIGAGTTGTAGKIFVGTTSSGLNAGQLAQIKFTISSVDYPATILSTGEIVPTLNYVITSISPSSPTVGIGFSVTVQSQSYNGTATNVGGATTFNLTNTNGGSIGGTTSGTIASATNSITVTGVTLSNTAAANATLTATFSSGYQLVAGTSAAFTVLAPVVPTQLVVTTVPAYAYAGTAFSVTVQSQDGSSNPQNVTSGTGISLANTGGGTIGSNTGTISNATNSTTISTVTLTTPATGVTLTASTTSGMSLTTSASSSSFTVFSTLPTAQPTGFTATATTATMTLGWTAASGSPTGYIVLRTTATGTTYPNTAPVNGTTYTAGGTLGNATIEYVGSSNSGIAIYTTTLTAASQYSYSIYSYNGSGSTISYLTSSPLQAQPYTLATAAANQPTVFAATAITSTGMTLGWTAATGSPAAAGYIVFRTTASSSTYPDALPFTPVSGTTYTAGTTYGTGGNVTCVYVGSSTSSGALSGLTANSQYSYSVYSYTGSAGTINYLTTSPLHGQPYTVSTAPTTQAASFSATATGANSFTVTLGTAAVYPSSGASKAGYLLLYTTGSTPTLVANPNGKTPASVISTGTQIAVTETSVPTAPTVTGLGVASGLTSNTKYYLTIVPYTWDGSNTATYSYLTTSAQTTNVTTSISLPWTENFDAMGSTGSTIFPTGWSYTNVSGTSPGSDNNTVVGTTYGGPKSGSNFLYTHYSSTSWIFTPGLPLLSGVKYTFSFYMENKDITSPVDFLMTVGYGTTASAAGMTNTLLSSYSCTNTSYTLFTYTFTAPSSNTFYFGIESVSATSTPWYLAFDDFSMITVPGAPTIGTATVSGVSGTASVPFTAPASNGGSAITSYTATSNPGSITGTLSQAGSGTITVSGLTNGTAYTFTVTATNAVGTSVASSASNSVTPYSTPAAPTITSIAGGNQQLTVNFTAGATNGSAITNYQYSTDGGSTWTVVSPSQTSSPIVITTTSGSSPVSLTNGTSYNIQIEAINAAGAGTTSGTTAATPFTTPGAPTITSITPSNQQLVVNYTAPGVTGGSAVTGYQYSTDGGSTFVTAGTYDGSTITITTTSNSSTTLVNGTSYNVQIKAVNAAGAGTATGTTTGTPYNATPVQLAISSVPAYAYAGTAFSVTIQAQDGSNNPQNVTSDAGISLSNTGGGTIGSNTGTILNGTSSITLSGVTLSTPATGVTLTANNTGGMSLTNSASSSSFTVYSTLPTAQPTGFTSSSTASTMTLGWTAASSSPTGYIVLRTTTSGTTYPNTAPVNGTTYTAGATIGNATIEYVGSSTSGVAIYTTSLSAASQYSYSVYSYNGSGTTISYLITSPLQAQPFTLAATAANQPTAFVATGLSTTGMTIGWTAATGSPLPTGYIVFRTTASSATSPDALGFTPSNGTTYTANSTYGTSGNVTCIYSGSALTTGALSGLSTASQYSYSIYSYTGTGSTINYLTTSPLDGHPYTLSTAPTTQPTVYAASSVTSSAMTVGWTAATGSPAGYIVLQSVGSTYPNTSPTSGTNYSNGTTIGNATVVYSGSSLSTGALTGLSSSTVYSYYIYSYNGSANTINYLTTSPLSGQTTTACGNTSLPYSEGFEGLSTSTGNTTAGSSTYLPNCWMSQSSQWSSESAALTYTHSHAGNDFLEMTWSSTNAYIWTPGFALTGGNTYAISFWVQDDGYGTSTSLPWQIDLWYNTVQSGTGTQIQPTYTAGQYTNGTYYTPGDNTYHQVSYNFTVPGSGTSTYYFGIRGNQSSGTPNELALDDISVTQLAACTTPTSPSGSLTIPTPSAGTVTGTFSAVSPTPTGYLVIRTSTSSAPTAPSSGVAYTAGTTALGGYIVSTNSSTGFTDNSVSPSNNYWYWVYSYNAISCTGGPLYSTTYITNNTTTPGCTYSTLYWAGTGSTLAASNTNTATTAYNTATNWSTSSGSYVAASSAPTVCNDVVIALTTNASTTVVLSANSQANSVTFSFSATASSTSGRTVALNIGTYSLNVTNNFSITNSNAGTATHPAFLSVNVSSGGSLTIGGNLSIANSGLATGNEAYIGNTGTVTINGTTLLTNTGATGSQSALAVDNSATFNLYGAVTLDNGTSTASTYLNALSTGGSNGTFNFYNNLIVGPYGAIPSYFSNYAGKILFDGTGTQTITDNCTNSTAFTIPNFQIGNVNNPIVTISGSNAKIQSNGNLTINGTSTLVIGSGETYNYTGTSTVTNTIASGATLKLSGTSGGQTGSNFPKATSTGTITNTLNGTVVYNASGSQTVFATPTYGTLIIGDGTSSTSATAGAGLTVNGSVTINSSASFIAGAYTHTVGGNWTNNGTFTGTGSTVTFNAASGTQTLNSGGSSFNNISHSGAGILQLVYSGLTTAGSFTNGGGNFDASTNNLGHTVTGLATISSGTYSIGISSAQNFNGGLTLSGTGVLSCSAAAVTATPLTLSGGTFTGAGGTVNASNVTITTGTLTAPSGTFNVSGNWSQAGGTFTAGSNTVTFTAASGTQTFNSGGTSFNNISHTGAGTVQLTAALTTGGTYYNGSSSGTFDANGNTHTVTGLITLNGGTYLSSTATQSFNGGLTVSGGTFTGSTGTVNTTNLNITSGSMTAPSTTLSLSGNFNAVASSFTHNSGTVTFTAASGTQTINSGGNSLYSISHTGSGVLQLATNLTAAGTFGNGVSAGNFDANGHANTVTGTATISNASYIVSNALQTLSGGVTVSTGATLDGSAAGSTISSSTNITLNGGNITTGTTGYTQSVGTLGLTNNSSIHLGSSSHSVTFANSSAIGWTSGKILTIYGWTGIYGSSGTAGQIFVSTSNSGLTGLQLSQIVFDGFTSGNPVLLSTGELVPNLTLTPPTLVEQTSPTPTVDGSFTVNFTDPGGYTSAISSITYGTSSLVLGTDYTLATGVITLIPTATNGLNIAGTQTLSVYATSYSTATCSVTIGAGAVSKLQVLMPGQTAVPGSSSGKTGTPTAQTAGTATTVTVNATDQYWNLVNTNTSTVVITSSDANAVIPANAALVSGTNTYSVTFKTATATGWTVTATDNAAVLTANTGTSTTVNAGAVAKLQVLMPGETAAPGTSTGKTGTPTAQTAGSAVTVTVNSVDANWNLVSNTSTVVITSSDANATLPANAALVGGTKTFYITFKTAGYQTVTSSDNAAVLTANTGSSTLINVGAAYKIQLLLPGETAAGGTTTGKTGTPTAETAGTPFNVTVNVVDANWNLVSSATNTVTITSTDVNATMPSAAAVSAGTGTFSVTLVTAGTKTVTATTTGLTTNSNTSPSVTINAGAFAKLQILLPGETAAAGTSTGKTGTPTAQSKGTAFTVTVNAVDANWNIVTGAAADNIAITSSDVAAGLPSNNTLSSGVRTFSVTLNTAGTATVTATDATDGTKTANTSASVTVNDVTIASDYFRSVSSAAWATASTWQSSHDNSTWITATLAPTSSATLVTVNNAVTITAISVGSVTIASAGTLTTSGAIGLNAGATISVAGILDMVTYKITAAGAGSTVSVTSTGKIRTSNTAGFSGSTSTTIVSTNTPTITLDPASTVEYYGTSTQTITNGLSYGNLTLSGSGTATLGGNTTLLGNYTQTAGTLIITPGSSAFTFTVGGTFTESAGTIDVTGPSATAGATVTVTGATSIFSIEMEANSSNTASTILFQVNNNVTFTGATETSPYSLDWMQGGTSGTVYPITFGITGNLTWSGAGDPYTSGSGTAKGFVFNGAGTPSSPQTLTYSGAASSYGQIYQVNNGTTVQLLTGIAIGANTDPYCSFTVNTGGKLDVQNYVISGGVTGSATSNTGFTLASGATLITSNGSGVGGSITDVVTNYNAAANYVFNATTTSPFPSTISTMNNLTLNANVSLGKAQTVAGTLTFTSGILTTTVANLLTLTNVANTAISGASSTSFINGPLTWTLGTASTGSYIVPVGVGTAYYPLAFTAGTIASGSPTINVTPNASGVGSADATTVYATSGNEYWKVVTTGTTFAATNFSLGRSTPALGNLTIIGKNTANSSYASIGGSVGTLSSQPSVNTSSSGTSGASTFYLAICQQLVTLSYNGNTSTSGGVPGSTNYGYNTTATVAANTGTLVKTGYTFSGWNTAADGSGTAYAATGSVTFTITSSTTLYAQWTGNVTYSVNGGSGTAPTDATNYLPGASVTTASGAGLTKSGYTFAGWNTAANGSGTTYAASTSAAFNFSGAITLYAKWTGNVTYSVNGGSGTAPTDATNYLSGASVTTASGSGLSYTGYTFAGWNTAADGSGTTYAASTGSAFTFSGAITLYAKWTGNVTYSVNGGSGTAPTDATNYLPGASVTTASGSGLTKSGYTFAGWNTASDGSGTTYAASTSGAFNFSGAITLYAKWTGNVTYSVNGGSGTAPTDVTNYLPGASVTTASGTGLTKSGYTFAGWNTAANGSGTTYAASTSGAFSFSGAITLYAKWTGNVTYSVNGGSGTAPTDANNYLSGASVTTASGSGLSYTGYTFAGWNTASDGSGTTYAASTGSAFTFSGAITLYAKWTFNVTYNGNGNTGGTAPTDATNYTQAASVNTASNSGTLVKAGYTFAGWNTASDGSGTTYTAPQTGAFSNTGNITLYAKWTGIAGYWVGTSGTDYSTAANWANNAVPTASDNVIINSGTPNAPALSGTGYANSLTISGSATLTITGTLNIAGDVSNGGTIAASAGTIEFNGTVAQSVAGGFTVNNLTIDNSAGVSLGSSSYSYDTVFVKGIYTPTSGTLTTNGSLVLVSDASGTASVAAGTGTYISGDVTVERFHNNKRAWLMITAPLTTYGSSKTGDIYSNWQQDTYITGNTTAPNGLDAGTNTAYGIKYWTGTAWANGISSSSSVNTNSSNSLFGGTGGSTADNKAFSVFVRGDRSVLPSLGATGHSAVTLRASGSLQTGTLTQSIAGSYSFAANPYAAPIDLDLFKNDNTDLASSGGNYTFYYWDPNLSGTGGYTTASYLNGAGWFYTSQNLANTTPEFVQSGQAFFVTNPNPSTVTSVTFNEGHKNTSNSSNGVFGNSAIGSIKVNLSKGSPLAMIDEVQGLYNNNFSAAVVSGEDAVKFWGNEENVSIIRGSSYLSMEARPMVATTDTMFLYMYNLVAGTSTYNFAISGSNMPANATGYLVDNYLGTQTPLNLSSVTNINFAVTTVAGSKASNRFMIVFTNTNPLSVDGMQIKASVKAKAAIVDWKVVTEKNVDHYEVERSNEGVSFVSIAIQAANNVNNSSYTYTDNQAANGANYYRIKAISKDATVQYSSVAKVLIGDSKEGISVYPNPIVGKNVNIILNNIEAGNYAVAMYNSAGKEVMVQNLAHAGGSVTTTVELPANLSTGVYQLRLAGNGRNYIETVIVK